MDGGLVVAWALWRAGAVGLRLSVCWRDRHHGAATAAGQGRCEHRVCCARGACAGQMQLLNSRNAVWAGVGAHGVQMHAQSCTKRSCMHALRHVPCCCTPQNPPLPPPPPPLLVAPPPPHLRAASLHSMATTGDMDVRQGRIYGEAPGSGVGPSLERWALAPIVGGGRPERQGEGEREAGRGEQSSSRARAV